MNFEEEVFIWAMTSRPEDTKKFANIFKPEWMHDARNQKILIEIYNFTKKYGTPPSIPTLRQIFQDQDKDSYESRFKESIDIIEQRKPDSSEMIYTLDKARDVCITRSFQALAQSPGFINYQSDNDGSKLLEILYKWLGMFVGLSEDKTYDIKTAFEKLILERKFEVDDVRIPSGIDPIDMWTDGGLRPRQLGILLAPTGHGKSATLTVMAHKIAAAEQKRVWFISNELPMNEVAERFLCKITGVEMSQIMEMPGVAYAGLDRYWKAGLHERLILTEINREVSTDEIEADMQKWITLNGWKPDVLILDFMERMKPNVSGVKRDQSWNWLGAIAKDLVRFAKRNNILVWSAAQTNRSGLVAKELMLDMAQGSIQHFQEAAVVVAMHQIDIPGVEDKIGMEMKALKMRHSKRPGKSVILEADLSRMSITNKIIEVKKVSRNEEDKDEEVDDDDKPRYRQGRRKRSRS